MEPVIPIIIDRQNLLSGQFGPAGRFKPEPLVPVIAEEEFAVLIAVPTTPGVVETEGGIKRRPDIFVLARASEEANEDKLARAGATRVVSPYLIGAKRMGQILKRPTVADFIDITTTGNRLGLVMEEANVPIGSKLNGKNLIDSSLRRDFGVIIVAIKRPSGEMIFNPMPTETLGSGDVIVVLGKQEDLKRMKQVL